MLRVIEIFLCYWVQAARRGGIFLALLFIIGAGVSAWYAAHNLKVNTDTTKMLSSSLSFQQKAKELQNTFPQIKNELSIIVRAPTKDELDVYSEKLYQQLKTQDEHIVSTFSPAHDPFFRENGLLFLSERELEEQLNALTKAAGLIETLIRKPGIDTLFETLADNDALVQNSDLSTETLERIYNQLADTINDGLNNKNTPFSWQGALKEDTPPPGGYLRIVNVTPVTDFSRLQPIKPALGAIKGEINTLNQEFDGRITALVTGTLALRGEELATVSTGIGYSFLLSFVLVSLLLFIAFRSFYVSILTVIGLLLTLTLTSAYAAYFYQELNLVSVAFTVLLVGLGLDFSIHLLLHLQEFRTKGQSLRTALNSTLRDIGGAMALAAPTTALAFFSFLPTSFEGIAQLGAVAGVGVLIAFFVSVTFLPAALGVAPAPPPRRTKGTVRNSFSFLQKLSIPFSILIIIAGFAATTLLPKARFDADPMALRSQKSESVIAFNMLFDDNTTTPYRLTRLVNNEQEARETAKIAEGLNTVRDSRSLVNFVPEDQDIKLELIDFASGSLAFVMNEEPAARDKAPTGSGIAALKERLDQTLADGDTSQARARLAKTLTAVLERNDTTLLKRLDDQIFAFWPNLVRRLQDQFRADYIDYDTLPIELTTRYLSENNKWRVDLLPAEDVRDPSKLDAYVNQVEEQISDIAGGAIHAKKAGDIIAKSMIQASLLALGIISIFLFIFIQKPLTILMILFPLGLAAILTIATGVLVDVPFNYANVIVLPLLMGIGVDSGIHLVMRQEKTHKSKDLNVYATATPRAVLFSALTTVASFGSLMLSEHRGTASMGQLLSIAIGYTLICTLIVLPALFKMAKNRGL